MAQWHLQHNQHWWHTDTCNTISTNGTLTHATQSSLMAHWHIQHWHMQHTYCQHWQHTNNHNIQQASIAYGHFEHRQSELTRYGHLQQSTLTATWCMYATCRQQVLTALTSVTDASGCKPTLFKFCRHTHTLVNTHTLLLCHASFHFLRYVLLQLGTELYLHAILSLSPVIH